MVIGKRRFRPVARLDPNRSTREHCPTATVHLVPDDVRELHHVKEWRNAAGVLTTACPAEWEDILAVLRGFRLLRSEVVVGGGNRSPVSRRVDGAFYARGWQEKEFATAYQVDGNTIESPTHAVDCYRAGVALEVEWNNKDPFFDRDLNNFRLLFDLRAIQVGVIITRATELQAIFRREGEGSSYGAATTHHEKLWPRLDGGGGCPVLTFAIKPDLFVDDGDAAVARARAARQEARRNRQTRRGRRRLTPIKQR